MRSNDDTTLPDRFESLDFAERWTRDAFAASAMADYFLVFEIDMLLAREKLYALNRERGDGEARISYTHLFVRATALALRAHPDLHVLYDAGRRMHPGSIDIALSVASETVNAPLLVIRNAAEKSLGTIAEEVARGAPQAIEAQQRELAQLRRWGRLVPFAWMRRFIMRRLMRQLRLLRSKAGTFQVTCMNTFDIGASMLLAHSGMLVIGRVRDRVVAVNGEAKVRPTVLVTCCADHGAWDGRRASRFMEEVRRSLESAEVD